MSKYIPIYLYAKKVGKSRQEIYRLIREKRFKPEDLITTEKIKEIMLINSEAEQIR